MKVSKGFTLLECILTLSLFSLVLVVSMNIYLTGYRLYTKQEYQVEVEQNVRVVLNRISETLRRTDNLSDKLYLSGEILVIGNTRYYQQINSVHERIGNGTNNLGQYISRFEPSIENGYLTIRIEAMPYKDEDPFYLEQVFYIGGE